MKELNRLISTISSSDIHPLEISSARMVSIDDSLSGLENLSIPPGEYLSVEMKVLIPAGK